MMNKISKCLIKKGSVLLIHFSKINMAQLGTVTADLIKCLNNGFFVKGRFEVINYLNNKIIIDFAHTEKEVEVILKHINSFNYNHLYIVVGCGGNRDKQKRPIMGIIATNNSDYVIFTSDNPRDEEPMDIIQDILVGVKKADGDYVMVPDRKEAIKYCMENAKDGDIIVLAGKGHEDYQEIKGIKQPMDERELIADIIKENPNIKL